MVEGASCSCEASFSSRFAAPVVSEGRYISAILVVAGGVATVSASVLMLRRTKFKIGSLGWGWLAALLTVMGLVLVAAGAVVGFDAPPVASPVSGRIAFDSNRDGNREIYVRAPTAPD